MLFHELRHVYIDRFALEAVLPDLEEADGGMEPVEDGQRHRDMRDYCPCPRPVEG